MIFKIEVSTLSNGIRVCTEHTGMGHVTSVGVFTGAGSRNEDIESSGTNYLLQKMMQRGTSTRTKNQIWEEFAALGAQLHVEAGREQTQLSTTVIKFDVNKVVALLGDMVSNSIINEYELELVKEDVSQEHETNHTDY